MRLCLHPWVGAVVLALFGCATHDAFCSEESVVPCVESCGTPVFRQCYACPAGAFDESLCAPPPSSCDAMHVRPAGSCDDATCTAGTNGRCLLAHADMVCTYDECTTDADCGAGRRCACEGGAGAAHVCVAAYCQSAADCGGLPCQPVVGCAGRDDPDFGGVRAFRCQTAADTCRTDADCTDLGTFCTVPILTPEDPPAGETWSCTASFCG